MTVPAVDVPGPGEIRAARERLGDRVRTTPVWSWASDAVTARLGTDTEVVAKLELWQVAGSFKPRGALTVMLGLDSDALERGVTAFSGGNHALAVAHAARLLGTTAKVVMPETANPARIEACRDRGAEVVLVGSIHEARDRVEQIADDEGRTFVHPFEGPRTVLGTATLGLELVQQVPDLDAVIVPIGGGGLAAGVAAAVKQLRPAAEVFGVEPEGADTMRRSFELGEPAAIDAVRTIADSLGAPRAEPYTYAVCRRFVDEIITVSDRDLAGAMRLLFEDLKLAVEPACAASTAALWGPLGDRLRGRRVALVLCGSNIDLATFARHLALADDPA